MASYPKLVLLLFCVVLLAEATNASVTDPTSCNDMCGNMSIPYPFGITEGCYFNKDFLVDCNTTTGIPYLWYETWNYHVLDFSLDGQLLIYTYIGKNCYSGNTTIGSQSHPRFPFSKTRNKFTALGCDTAAYIQDTETSSITGCMSMCQQKDLKNGSSSGAGCCQTPTPETDMLNFEITVASFFNHRKVSDFSPCSYAFLVDQDHYTFSISDLENFPEVVPTTLDWAIGNQTCEEAKSSGEYVCGSHTTCVDSDNGPGYRCSCSSGFEGNPYLPNGCQDINECDMPHIYLCFGTCINTFGSYNCTCPKGWKYNGHDCFKDYASRVALVPSIGLGTIVLFLLSFWLCLVLRKRKQIRRKAKHFERNGGLLLQQKMTSSHGVVDKTKVFTADELEKATDNFHEDRILGQGGQGTVYKGMLTDGRIVAIKKSKKIDESQLGQFINELVILSQINHRNIVKLLGCCLETEVPTLVYEFIQNGTLSQQIHSPSDELPITWEMRLQIAADSAGALAYLHSASSFPIYHRDIKTSNILLDEKYKAKVANFGISRLVPIDDTHLTVTDAFGTFGYMDPAYFQSRMFTEKSDVYSFGVVLLELLTGKRPIQPNNNASQERMSLVAWFFTAMKHPRHDDIFDQVIRTDKQEELFAVANLAKRCLDMDSKRRHTMKEVAAELEAIKAHNFSYSFEQNLSETDEHPSFESDICEGTYGYSSSSTFYLDLSSPSVDAKPLLLDATR
ncbi:hypothetical protein Drorol1_Dr00020959 [Drosera rotundifolia]